MGSPSVGPILSKKEKLIDPIRDIEVERIGRDERAREGEEGGREGGREPCHAANDRQDRNPSGEHVTDEPIACHNLGITSADKEGTLVWSKMKRFIELLLLIGKTIEVR
jgi:hypothetical protein